MTRDIDIVVELTEIDIDRVTRAFEPTFYVDPLMVAEAVTTTRMFNFTHSEFHVKVDFIVRKNEPYRKIEFSRRKQFTLWGITLWIVSPEDLILSKLSWAKESLSELQLADVRDLVKSIRNLDQTYLDQWLDKLSLRDLYVRALK